MYTLEIEKDDVTVEETDSPSTQESTSDAVEDDGTPVLDEEDLEENDLTDEDAENIEWDEPQTGDTEQITVS